MQTFKFWIVIVVTGMWNCVIKGVDMSGDKVVMVLLVERGNCLKFGEMENDLFGFPSSFYLYG